LKQSFIQVLPTLLGVGEVVDLSVAPLDYSGYELVGPVRVGKNLVVFSLLHRPHRLLWVPQYVVAGAYPVRYPVKRVYRLK